MNAGARSHNTVPSCRNCLYYLNGHCYYKHPPLERPAEICLFEICRHYQCRLTDLDTHLREVIGREGIVLLVPTWLLRPHVLKSTNSLEELLVSVTLEKIYPTWCLVSYRAGKSTIRTQLRNQSLLSWNLAFHEYTWKRENGTPVPVGQIKKQSL